MPYFNISQFRRGPSPALWEQQARERRELERDIARQRARVQQRVSLDRYRRQRLHQDWQEFLVQQRRLWAGEQQDQRRQRLEERAQQREEEQLVSKAASAYDWGSLGLEPPETAEEWKVLSRIAENKMEAKEEEEEQVQSRREFLTRKRRVLRAIRNHPRELDVKHLFDAARVASDIDELKDIQQDYYELINDWQTSKRQGQEGMSPSETRTSLNFWQRQEEEAADQAESAVGTPEEEAVGKREQWASDNRVKVQRRAGGPIELTRQEHAFVESHESFSESDMRDALMYALGRKGTPREQQAAKKLLEKHGIDY